MVHNQVTKYALSFFNSVGRETVILASDASLTAIGSGLLYGICVDNSGNAYVTDPNKHIIIKIYNDGRVKLLAGASGVSGNNGANIVSFSEARFDQPCGIDIDQSGNLYVADTGNNQIRKLGNNRVSLLAGDPSASAGLVNSRANPKDARFFAPVDVKADDGGRVYVADRGNHAVRIIDGPLVATIAGNGIPGDLTGNPNSACLNNPNSIAVNKDGHIFIADTDNYKIKVIYGTDLFHFSGSGAMGNNLGDAQTSQYQTLKYLDIESSGTIYAVNSNPVGDSEILRIDDNGVPRVATEFEVASDAYVTGVSNDRTSNIYVTESEYGEFDLESSSSSTEVLTTSSSISSQSSSPSSVSSVSSSSYCPPFEVKILTPFSGADVSIYFSGDVDIDIDWGDGTPVQNVTSDGEVIHTYFVPGGNYYVRMSGQANTISFNVGWTPLMLREVITPCSIRNITTFQDTFRNCDKLTSIPSGLFDDHASVSSFQGTFFACRALTSIPSGLFDNNINVTDFNNIFSTCMALTSIPSGLFDNNINVTDFNNAFSYCIALTSIPSGLFDNNINVTDFSNAFYYCRALTSIPSGLFDNNINVTDFSNAFYYCDAITSIPSGLFDNNMNVTNFSGAFYFDGAITSIVPSLWLRVPEPTGTNCYTACTGAANWGDIPTAWGGA